VHRAARTSDPAVVDLLLKASSNVNITNKFQQTPLARFVGKMGFPPWESLSVDGKTAPYRLETLGMLISAGADVNVQDDRGRTPFHELLLCTMGDSQLPLKLAAAKVLLEAGARMDSADSDGRTVSDLILADDRAALRSCLLESP
jgi:ankyrin repeat protein